MAEPLPWRDRLVIAPTPQRPMPRSQGGGFQPVPVQQRPRASISQGATRERNRVFESGQRRQAEIRQMLLQMVQNDPYIDLSKIAPKYTDLETWNFVTEAQKRLTDAQKKQIDSV